MKKTRAVLVLWLAVSAVYLYAWPAPTLLYACIVLLHAAAGVWLAIELLLRPALRKLFRGICPAKQAGGWTWMSGGAVLGILLIFAGARHNHWPLLYAHIVLCLVALALLAGAWAGRQGWLASQRSVAMARYGIFFLAAAVLSADAWWMRTARWQRAYRIQNPQVAPVSMNEEGDGPSGPFFPSSAQTPGRHRIPASFFLDSESCRRCHADIYDQWKSSAHHFSSFNNQWYRKSVEYMQDVVGAKPPKWCGGCHDPALLFTGMMDRPIRQVENTPEGQAGLGCTMCHSIAAVKSTMGQADFTLEYPQLHRLASSANPVLRQLHDFVVELNPEPHRRVFLKPFMRRQTAEFCSACHKVHLDVPVNHYRWTRGFNEYDSWQASGISGQGARSFYYPSRAQNCADCHMPALASRDPANRDGLVHSHRFLAANTALPFEEQDRGPLEATENFLRDGNVGVDIFALSPEPPGGNGEGAAAPSGAATPGIAALRATAGKAETTFAVGEESELSVPAMSGLAPAAVLSAPLDRVHPTVRRGDTVRVDVVVRTRKVGHFFPGGTVDAFDVWLQFMASDDRGRVLFSSGEVEDHGRGPVDPGAHFYRSLLIDAHGNPINKRNAWAARSLVYARLIPPGAADTVHYRVHIPANAGNRIHLLARLNYRKFSRYYTQFAFAGMREPSAESSPAASSKPSKRQAQPSVTPDFDDGRFVFTADTSQVSGKRKEVPSLPIVTLAEQSVDVQVRGAAEKAPAPAIVLDPAAWQRWNDYGIGLLLQGDLRGAKAAFENVTRADPANPDGWVNIGRVELQEGNTAAARPALERALKLAPHLARALFFYAKALKNDGRYDQAAAHLREVLAQYPRDRVAHNELGRLFFLQRQYSQALAEFESALAIDPEDLQANYNLMLCATGLGQSELARRYQQRYLRFKADESAASLAGPYLRAHPQDNLERQAIHEHPSAPLPNSPLNSAAIRGGR